MIKKRTYWIIFLCGFILLVSGIGTSYYWITRIYLPEQLNADANSKLLVEWTANDMFTPPIDGKITKENLAVFLLINESLTSELQQLRKLFEESSWDIAFEVIKMQPEWAGKKYLALKKFGMTPKEYDWMVSCVINYWIYRWKEESFENLRQFGWELDDTTRSKVKPQNYELFNSHKEDLNRIFDILWPEKQQTEQTQADTLVSVPPEPSF